MELKQALSILEKDLLGDAKGDPKRVQTAEALMTVIHSVLYDVSTLSSSLDLAARNLGRIADALEEKNA